MKNKKILAALTAAVIGFSLAGCGKFPVKTGNVAPPSDPPSESTMESVEPEAVSENQVVGKVTSLDGTKITIELGKLTPRSPKKSGNGNGNSGTRATDSTRKERSGAPFGYNFSSTGKTATYDLSGLKEIKLENDSDDTTDTVDEIKTGDIVVLETGKDGAVTSLTVKDLNSKGGNRSRNRNGNGSNKTGNNNNRKSRSSMNNRSGDQNRDV